MTVPDDGCTHCPLTGARAPADDSRRDFLRRAAGIAATLGLAAVLPSEARAFAARREHAPTERRYPIPAADGVQFDAENSLIIARGAGHAFCFSLACPHQNTALRWDQGDGEFRCPKHKSRYRADGTFIDGRATRAMDRLAIRRDATSLIVDLETLVQQDEHPALWAAAFVAV